MRQPKQHPAYKALCAISKQTGYPTRFETDLHTHDKASIERNPEKPFAWVLGDRGAQGYWYANERELHAAYLSIAKHLEKSTLAQ